jgi:heptosyltransferase II
MRIFICVEIMQQANKILIVGPDWIGDTIMSQSLFKLIKQRNASAQIDVMASPLSQPLLERMPEVSQTWVVPFHQQQWHLRGRYQLAKKIREQQYDQAIVLPQTHQSAWISFFAKIPRRTGWFGDKRWGLLTDIRHMDKTQYPLMIQRFVALGLPAKAKIPDQIALPRLKIDPESCEAVLRRLQLFPEAGPILVMCPGAEFGVSKRWPEQHYAEVARQLLEQGWQVWLMGEQQDQGITNAIEQKVQGRCYNLVGKASLSEMTDLLSVASKVLTNDSGLMHVANAVGCDCVVLYGASSPDFAPPLSNRAKMITSNVDCSPCFKRTCPLEHHDCMNKILPGTVVNNIIATVAHSA